MFAAPLLKFGETRKKLGQIQAAWRHKKSQPANGLAQHFKPGQNAMICRVLSFNNDSDQACKGLRPVR